LLAIAQSLIDEGRFSIAVLTALIACEVAAEKAFRAACAAKGLEDLGDAVLDLMNGHNLGSDRNRKLYNVLTGEKPETQAFWSAFKAAAQKRNRVVHRGEQANKTEAEAALKAARGLVTYLKQ
jgi:hypothetical protein